MKLKFWAFWQRWKSYIYRKVLSLSSTWQFSSLPFCQCGWTLQGGFEKAYPRLVTGEICKPITVEKMDRWAELEWAKVHCGILFIKLFDTLDTNLENTQRLHSTARNISGTVCVVQLGDKSCDLIISRVKFMEAQGNLNRPSAIQYLSTPCYILQLALRSGSEEVMTASAPVCCVLQAANTCWNSLMEDWLQSPDFTWLPVRRGLCCSKEFQKALDEIKHDTHSN